MRPVPAPAVDGRAHGEQSGQEQRVRDGHGVVQSAAGQRERRQRGDRVAKDRGVRFPVVGDGRGQPPVVVVGDGDVRPVDGRVRLAVGAARVLLHDQVVARCGLSAVEIPGREPDRLERDAPVRLVGRGLEQVAVRVLQLERVPAGHQFDILRAGADQLLRRVQRDGYAGRRVRAAEHDRGARLPAGRRGGRDMASQGRGIVRDRDRDRPHGRIIRDAAARALRLLTSYR